MLKLSHFGIFLFCVFVGAFTRRRLWSQGDFSR